MGHAYLLWIGLALVFVIVLLTWLGYYKGQHRVQVQEAFKQERKTILERKFGDGQIAQSIIDQDVWKGATLEMMVEAFGYPDAEEERVYKETKQLVYKYIKNNQPRQRTVIFFEHYIVVGWRIYKEKR